MAARSYPNPPGRPPKPESQRRRRNTPKSYGAAQATTAPAAEAATRELGIDAAHPLVADLWNTVQRSCESAFYSDADWVKLRLEMFHLNALMTGRRQLTLSAWSAVQTGLNELLLSPAVKRRAGIELKRAVEGRGRRKYPRDMRTFAGVVPKMPAAGPGHAATTPAWRVRAATNCATSPPIE